MIFVFVVVFGSVNLTQGGTNNLFYPDSTDSNSDSVKIEKTISYWDTIYTDQPIKSPVTTMLKSLILPGWGQLSNGKKSKAVSFFVTEGAILYQIYDLNKRFNRYRDIHILSGTGRFYKKRHLIRRKDFTWLFAIIHLYNVLDAVTDSYLFNFNDIMGEKNSISIWQEENTYWATFRFSL